MTSIELMPVHAFIDEHHLANRACAISGVTTRFIFRTDATLCQRRMLTSNCATWFARFTMRDSKSYSMLPTTTRAKAVRLGPHCRFAASITSPTTGHLPHDPGDYINDTGCGNTLNVEHPRVGRLVLDSLGYFSEVMGVDGFRFDLATILGRRVTVSPRGIRC